METIKKDTVKQLKSEIQSLKSIIEDLQVEVKGWKADYSGLVTILKPLIEEMVTASMGHREARKNQLDFASVFALVKALGFIDTLNRAYGGPQKSESSRVLSLLTGYSAEEFRKALTSGDVSFSVLDKDSMEPKQDQLVRFLRDQKCNLTADLVGQLGGPHN